MNQMHISFKVLAN